jgi:AcrR family transcriptional regulator
VTLLKGNHHPKAPRIRFGAGQKRPIVLFSTMAKGERTRRDIIDHAFALAKESGLEGVSLGVLASQAGLSKSGLFAHFKSKEALQLGVLQEAVDRFGATVLRPALDMPRGEARVRALFEHFLRWKGEENPSGCIFMALSYEYDDRPGPIRDRLVAVLRDWHNSIRRVAQAAVETGEFRADLDTDLFAFEFQGIAMSHHHAGRLLEHPQAEKLNWAAFEALLARSRAAISAAFITPSTEASR